MAAADGADAAADGAAAAVAFGNAKVTSDEPTEEENMDKFAELNKQLYDPVPTDACLYGKSNFWDGRYMKNEEVSEWLVR